MNLNKRTYFVLQLTEQNLAIVSKALGAQPFELVAPVIGEIQRQINEQIEADTGQQDKVARNGGAPKEDAASNDARQ